MPVDSRFYAPLGALTLKSASEITGLTFEGDLSAEITGIATTANARRGDIAFLEGDGRKAPDFSDVVAAVITNESSRKFIPEGVPFAVSATPRYHLDLLASRLFSIRHYNIRGTDFVSSDAKVHESAIIGPGAVIGDGAVIGESAVIGPNAVIGPGVQIGRHTRIGAGATLFCCLIGNHVSILSGASIGETGFGVMAGPTGSEDAPHYGRVVIQDYATIGANTCIDRGVFDDTIIGERTKIDNLCQIAHNVVFGRSVVMAAFGGISGSVTVGDGSMLGGRVGIADHVTIGERVNLAASAGIFRDIPDGETWGGTPGKPIKQWMREVAWLQKQSNPKKTKD